MPGKILIYGGSGGIGARVTADAGDALDGLVYAVGTITVRPFPRLSAADFVDDFRVNALAAFLLSADASWMTGQVIGVDGGRSALHAKE